jgi:hypothetical protein
LAGNIGVVDPGDGGGCEREDAPGLHRSERRVAGLVGRRVNEDFHLLQELSAAKAPSEIWNAWARFWQKAVEDYGAECACMAKLAAGLLPSDVAISQNDSDSNTQTARRQAKAA